jgi:hypothetical protein
MHRRKKYWIVILLLIVWGKHSQAQDTLSFSAAESGTYELYLGKQWSQLQKLCSRAFKNGYDYYYLRLRAGIAAYELKQYREAIRHFQGAIRFNADDNLAFEYLYYCYLYTNRNEAAKKLSLRFDKEFASYMKTKKLNPINYLMAEGGTKLSDSINFFGPAVFGQLGIQHAVARRLSLFHTLGYYQQSEKRFSVGQFQYYVKATLPLPKELTLEIGSHLLYNNVSYTQQALAQYTVQDPPAFKGGPFPPARTVTGFQIMQENVKSLAFVGAANLTKHFSFADVSIGSTAFLLDTARQYQVSAGFVIYPFRNNRLGIGSNWYIHTENQFKSSSLAYAPMLTAAIGKKLYLSLSYFSNNGLNITEQTGYFINNSYDYTANRLVLSPSFAFSPGLTAYANVGFERKIQITEQYEYHYTIFVLGIRIHPFKKRN